MQYHFLQHRISLSPFYLLLWARIPEKKWSSPHSQQKSSKCSTWVQSQKRQNDPCLFRRQTIQQHSTQVYAPITNAEEVDVKRFYEDPQDFLELTPKKDVLFIIGACNAKVTSQKIPEVIGKFGLGVQNEADQRLTEFLPREPTSHNKHPLPTTQETTLHMDITRWSTPKVD